MLKSIERDAITGATTATDFDLQRSILEVFAEIGPEAREAVPSIRTFLGDQNLDRSAKNALVRIEADGEIKSRDR